MGGALGSPTPETAQQSPRPGKSCPGDPQRQIGMAFRKAAWATRAVVREWSQWAEARRDIAAVLL